MEVARDAFLDAYGLWMSHRSPITYARLADAVMQLRALDQRFVFTLPPEGDAFDA